jgi:hypothetical protein
LSIIAAHRGFGRRSIRRDDDALAGGEAIGLDDQRIAEAPDRIAASHRRPSADAILRGRHADAAA